MIVNNHQRQFSSNNRSTTKTWKINIEQSVILIEYFIMLCVIVFSCVWSYELFLLSICPSCCCYIDISWIIPSETCKGDSGKKMKTALFNDIIRHIRFHRSLCEQINKKAHFSYLPAS